MFHSKTVVHGWWTDLAKFKYLLVNQELLPAVYAKVVTAKSLLASGEAASATQAAKMAGISRSAYYKYKDGIFEYDPQNGGEMLTLSLKLKDTKGVLSAVTAELYRLGANVFLLIKACRKTVWRMFLWRFIRRKCPWMWMRLWIA